MTGPGDPLHGLRQRIARYYGDKIDRHGPTPRGVDWSCEPTQFLRFVQLLRICDFSAPFSLNDIGCGYGALLGLIRQRHSGARIDYLGIDLAEEMVAQARRKWSRRAGASFHLGAEIPRCADYSVASGIFNVRLDEPLPLWEEFIAQTLRQIAHASKRGFAVNFLARLPKGMQDVRQLYSANPGRWIEFCRRELAAEVALLDGYGMREFTLLVRTAPPLAQPATPAPGSPPR